MGSKVALIKSDDHFEGVQESLKLFKEDIENALARISSLIIKINLVVTRVPLSTTPLHAVRSFIEFISPFYKGKIIIAEAASWGDTNKAFQEYSFTKLAEENPQIHLLNLKKDETLQKEIKCPQEGTTLPFSKTLVDAPFIVSITRPKTHCNVVATLGIKNVLVGAILGYHMRRKIHRDRARFIHYFLASIADIVYPDLVILDGTIGMEGNGPVRGTEINAKWALASLDPLAADSLASHLMGFNINDVGYLNLLGEKDLGALYPKKQIEIVGETPEKLITPFKPHRTFKQQKQWRE